MIWLAWRQFRTQALVVSAVLVLIGVALAVTGPHLLHLYDTDVATCGVHGDCSSVTQNFLDRAHWKGVLNALVLVAPALIGIFLGAPVVARELENGTYRLAWTQSVTRSRWIATKLAVVGLGGMVVAGLVSLMVTWWSSPVDRLQGAPFGTFDQRDVAPVAYAAFAVTLGVAAGALIRRTLPAMAATLVAFIGVRYAIGQWVRPGLATPLHLTTVFLGPGVNGPGLSGSGTAASSGLIISDQIINGAGKVIGQNGGIGPDGNILFTAGPGGPTTFVGVGRCPNPIPPPPSNSTGGGGGPKQVPTAVVHAVQKCIGSFHLREVLTYQPASRYWSFQLVEAGIFVVLALGLAGFTLWWVRRRLS